MVVDDAREDLLARTVLARDEHGEVHRCYFQGYFDGSVEGFARADNVVTLFGALDVFFAHKYNIFCLGLAKVLISFYICNFKIWKP